MPTELQKGLTALQGPGALTDAQALDFLQQFPLQRIFTYDHS